MQEQEERFGGILKAGVRERMVDSRHKTMAETLSRRG